MENRKNLYIVAYVFQIISIILNIRIIPFFLVILYIGYEWLFFVVISLLAYLLPIIWMVPMVLMTKKVINEIEPKTHVGLGIFTLLFQSVIAGILILVATNSQIKSLNNNEVINPNIINNLIRK